VQHEGRQSEGVVAVEVREEDSLDRARVNADAPHVREQGRAAIKEQAAIDHDCPVVPVQRERRAGTEERELYAMVTDWFRYTS
jgi:hypothetical protein